MIDLYNYSNLEGLLDGLTDLNRIPKEYSAVLEPYFQNIARNAHLKSRALKICRSNFHKWNEEGAKTVNPEIIRRCLNLWYVLKGKEYKKLKGPPPADNIIKDEIDVSYVKNLNVVRLEFDEFGKLISNPLENLILEEVEVNDFIQE
ncbi:AAR_G0047120.mRNA.1.CDS.1 [Saccharomyces cerevisiae]|nr:Swm2p [Saccharomyces cerevisiae YJM271]CAI4739128.1 AAR_G0047120.mRNA.1.CDS.1 [Saccharomyces cerevisiae]CAI6867787.1 AAR_G0047120.mRNA.1.CDS.1 [Saccharomyces cerevisiae]